jgi:hypothetical protein
MSNLAQVADGSRNTRLILKPDEKISATYSCAVVLEEFPRQFKEFKSGRDGLGLDYLTVVCTVQDFEMVGACLRFVAGSWIAAHKTEDSQAVDDSIKLFEFSERGFTHGNLYCENTIRSPIGISGGYSQISFTDENGEIHDQCYRILLKISGKYFEPISLENQWRLCRGLKFAFNARCSRIDIANDDSTFKRIPVTSIAIAWQRGDIFGFQDTKIVSSSKAGKEYPTLYLGSRNSGKMGRIYPHQFSDESISLRFEVEYKRQYAPAIFDMIASVNRDSLDWDFSQTFNQVGMYSTPVSQSLSSLKFDDLQDFLTKLLGAVLIGTFDFRDKSTVKDISKASVRDTKRLDFWSEFCSQFNYELKVKLPKVTRSIDKVKGWAKRQWSSSVFMIKAIEGRLGLMQLIDELLSIGEQNLSPWHRARITEFKYQFACQE